MTTAGESERIPAPQTANSVAQIISTGMVQLIARYTGRGPTKARATVIANVVLVVFRDVMTKAESSLAAVGHTDDVRSMRLSFQKMIHDEAKQVVEEATGRRVESLLADFDPEANAAAQVFILEIAETGEVGTAEATAE